MVDVQHCRSCGAPVMWLKNQKTGKPAPIDEVPATDGNILVLMKGEYKVLSRSEMMELYSYEDALHGRGPFLHTNHFMTCPQANTWRQSGYHTSKEVH